MFPRWARRPGAAVCPSLVPGEHQEVLHLHRSMRLDVSPPLAMLHLLLPR